MSLISRRRLIGAGALGMGGLLAGCDSLAQSPGFMRVLDTAETGTLRWQRLIGRDALAEEYRPDQLSPVFKANGTRQPQDADYLAHAASNFADWRLRIDGLVRQPLAISLEQLRSMPARAQITRHDCVEGWSAIGKWTGPQLGPLLRRAGLLPSARYIVFHCADTYSGEISKGGKQSSGKYYESVDLVDAFHPQTILAHTMNDRVLPIAYGAPLRLRVERQLGYKHAKYLMRIEAVASFAAMELGKGSYWADRGYEWYAGI